MYVCIGHKQATLIHWGGCQFNLTLSNVLEACEIVAKESFSLLMYHCHKSYASKISLICFLGKCGISSVSHLAFTTSNMPILFVYDEYTRHSFLTCLIGHYNPSARIIDLVSYNTYVVCVNSIHKWRDLQFNVCKQAKLSYLGAQKTRTHTLKSRPENIA